MLVSRQIPNICQTDATIPILGVHDPEGKQGAGRISNGLTFCSLRELLPSQEAGESDEKYKSKLIEALAQAMGTSNNLDDSNVNVGTTPQQYMDGLAKFIGNRGFKFTKDTEWKGWGAAEVSDPTEPMTQAELLKNLADPGHDVTGHVGWYLNPSTGLYKRQGGHFVAFQGTDGNTVSLQDSSPRSGGRLTEGVRLITRSGIFKKKSEQETRADQIQLDGIAARKYGDTSALGILDGIFKWGVEKKRS